jgi:hypothetical protein
MTAARATPDGTVVVETAAYRLEVAADGLLATIGSPGGERWAALRPHAAFDSTDGTDETLEVEPPRLLDGGGARIEIRRRSTRWAEAGTTIECSDGSVELRSWVVGRGRLTDVRLLGLRSSLPGRPSGVLPSGSSFRTLFSPNPGDPGLILRSAAEPAAIGIVGDSQPGRGHWFFSPAPLFLALTTAQGLSKPASAVREGWTALALEAPVDELTFVQLVYEASDRAFGLRLEYEGHTEVDGRFDAPAVVLTPGLADPYEGLRRHRTSLSARGAAPEPAPRDPPAWWSEPIFCGWGAQCHLAATTGGRGSDHSTQASYDAFLDHLEERGVVPGTVVLDDKWQEAYGTCTPDLAKWPDLAGWIADRHARGQRVLLWWKAWDPEGLPPELCIRNADGVPLALDPGSPEARALLAETVTTLLSPDGLDADGLKVDFTSAAPSGETASRAGRWGIALLHDLLSVVYAAAKQAKDDALVVTHTPHPGFVDVTDMLRLNDLLRLDDLGPRPEIVPQMRYRAAVVRAVAPELLVETDDWCVPDRRQWREYLEVKPELGVPSLYYATHLDLTGEPLEDDDYEALRRTWADWSARRQAVVEA